MIVDLIGFPLLGCWEDPNLGNAKLCFLSPDGKGQRMFLRRPLRPRAGSVQVETLKLMGPLSIPCWARDRTENRIHFS
jgi:hypothetical protein